MSLHCHSWQHLRSHGINKGISTNTLSKQLSNYISVSHWHLRSVQCLRGLLSCSSAVGWNECFLLHFGARHGKICWPAGGSLDTEAQYWWVLFSRLHTSPEAQLSSCRKSLNNKQWKCYCPDPQEYSSIVGNFGIQMYLSHSVRNSCMGQAGCGAGTFQMHFQVSSFGNSHWWFQYWCPSR